MVASGRTSMWALAVVAHVMVAAVACGTGGMAADRTGADAADVPCADALRFADQERLPEGARDAECTALRGIDTQYDVRFRIRREGLAAWLDEAYPEMSMSSTCADEQADRCGHLDLDPYAKGGAVGIDLTVRYEKGRDALVSFRPFDV